MTPISLKKHYWQLLKRIEQLRSILRLQELALRNRISSKKITDTTGPVVSLTSYGSRVNSVYLAIESMGLGDTLPSQIILWLDEQSVFANPPLTLQRLKSRGLEIKKCENFGPHKKYYCFVESESTFSAPLVTADDDVIYPKDWLKKLVSAFSEESAVINCHRARTIPISNSAISPYITWPLCSTTQPSFRNMAIGLSGVIYPPKFLSQLKEAGRGFIHCTPKADDIWLHVIAIRNGWKIRQLSDIPLETEVVPETQDQGLFHENQFSGRNDVSISRTYLPSDIGILVG